MANSRHSVNVSSPPQSLLLPISIPRPQLLLKPPTSFRKVQVSLDGKYPCLPGCSCSRLLFPSKVLPGPGAAAVMQVPPSLCPSIWAVHPRESRGPTTCSVYSHTLFELFCTGSIPSTMKPECELDTWLQSLQPASGDRICL